MNEGRFGPFAERKDPATALDAPVIARAGTRCGIGVAVPPHSRSHALLQTAIAGPNACSVLEPDPTKRLRGPVRVPRQPITPARV